jgi:hypothetical protein
MPNARDVASVMEAAMEPLLDPADVARLLKLVRKDGTLNVKRVYELPIHKTKIGRTVRYAPSDVRLYLALRAA